MFLIQNVSIITGNARGTTVVDAEFHRSPLTNAFLSSTIAGSTNLTSNPSATSPDNETLQKPPQNHGITRELSDDSTEPEIPTPSEEEHPGLFSAVVQSVAGAVGTVVGLLQAKAAESNATADGEEEYLPFSVKEAQPEEEDSKSDELDAESTEAPKGIVDTVIQGVLTLFTGKDAPTEAVIVKSEATTTDSSENEPLVMIPVTGEFIALPVVDVQTPPV